MLLPRLFVGPAILRIKILCAIELFMLNVYMAFFLKKKIIIPICFKGEFWGLGHVACYLLADCCSSYLNHFFFPLKKLHAHSHTESVSFLSSLQTYTRLNLSDYFSLLIGSSYFVTL